ncbi:hypothetical protein AVEN_209989-1 [Araneus ventricosus]|uniref:Uncharacterized protein n=1 Tax=Araneus ventricosus TaxID=182803 RepID=A0A4Y2M0K3_ARAVE|nr:hypothetical protein AVEN_209989-1 [Araneus ventricosus]
MARTTPELAAPLQTSAPHQRETLRLIIMLDLTCSRSAYVADLQCNRISNLEPSGSEAEASPIGHRSLASPLKGEWTRLCCILIFEYI